MTYDRAVEILDRLFSEPEIRESDEPLFIECLMFLATQDGRDLQGEAQFYLGEYYSSYDRYDIAEKYWKMGAENGFDACYSGLGDVYCFEESMKRDYKKAFEYYSKGAELDNLYCKRRVAEMYRDGQYVEKDLTKFKELISELYISTKDNEEHWKMYPDIAYQYAEMLYDEDRKSEATAIYAELLVKFKEFIAYRRYTGSIDYLIKAVDRYYQLVDFEEKDLDLYTMSYLMKNPVMIHFMYNNETFEVETVDEEGEIVVRFGEKWYRSVEDFYMDARIGENSITSLAYEFYDFEVI